VSGGSGRVVAEAGAAADHAQAASRRASVSFVKRMEEVSAGPRDGDARL
jgi:hypothetical protein